MPISAGETFPVSPSRPSPSSDSTTSDSVPVPLPPTQSAASASPTPTPNTDTFANQIACLLAAVQSGDFETARRLIPAVQGDTWPFYPPARVAQLPQSAVDTDLRAFTSAVLSGDISLAQNALTALYVDSAIVATVQPRTSTDQSR